MQAKAGEGLCDHAAAVERDIVRAGKKVLFRVRVGDQLGAVLRKSWAEIRALPTGEPELIGFDGRIGAANHLEFKIRDNGTQRHRRMLEKPARAEPARLF